MSTVAQRLPLGWPGWLTMSLLLGYIVLTRSFAHLGAHPVYIGELALLAFLVLRPSSLLCPAVSTLAAQSPLSGFSWCLYGSIVFGAWQCVRGLEAGHDPSVTVQNLVFHTYPLFLFPGIWIGRRHPDFLPRMIRALAWIHGLYGIAFLTILSSDPAPQSGLEEEVDWFGEPAGAAIALLGLLSFERRLSRLWLPLLLNVFVLLGIQVRAEWVGFIVALAIWVPLSGRIGPFFKLAAAAFLLLSAGWFTDARIPSPGTRAGEISVRNVVARVVAPVAPRLATELSPRGAVYTGTTDWRKDWWVAIWERVHEQDVSALLGPGYGFPIWELHPIDLGEVIRTPHNVFMYALGYTGWTGVWLFYLLQLALFWPLWRVYQRTGQPFGLAYCAMILAWAHFDNMYETPYGAIPYYLIAGLALAPLFEPLAPSAASHDAPTSPVTPPLLRPVLPPPERAQ